MAGRVHARTRAEWDLPEVTPRSEEGLACTECVNGCRMAEGETGLCGLRSNRGGRMTGATEEVGKVSWYHDPLPTNCVADWVCAGGTGAGYPRFAHCPGPERGYLNLAVFFSACSFDCLFCQNWSYRQGMHRPGGRTPQELADAVSDTTSCICHFGGDPGPQAPWAIKASRRALECAGDRILRICWETNGSVHPDHLDEMLDLSLSTGGCVKFDLKALSDPLHLALTGVTNRRTLANFRRAAGRTAGRLTPPGLIASTLLVPGYLEAEEVGSIASFIAGIDAEIPYSLLAFHPQFRMTDLPATSRQQADECLEAALEAGLKRAKVGNVHLLR
ncbi:MAG: radical SAM protein [bacterium]|nr:MAG: radical SAM protein [bacterium]